MRCEEFLEGYSDYLDGLLSQPERERFNEHLDGCDSCTRYDRVVQRGLTVVRSLPRVNPPSDFLPRLRHRIYHIEDDIPFSGARPGGSAALVAVAVVGLFAVLWLPFASHVPIEVELPAVAVERPAPEVAEERPLPSLFDPGPFVVTGREAPSAVWVGRNVFEGVASEGLREAESRRLGTRRTRHVR